MIEYKKYTATELKTLFSKFMKEQYEYVPSFKVGIYAFYALPVTIEFNDQGEKFEEFLSNFKYDMHSIPDRDWYMGDAYDYGDQLLELIHEHPIVEYDIIGAKMGHDVYFEEGNDEGAILIAYDTSKFTHFLTKSEIEQQLAYDE